MFKRIVKVLNSFRGADDYFLIFLSPIGIPFLITPGRKGDNDPRARRKASQEARKSATREGRESLNRKNLQKLQPAFLYGKPEKRDMFV